MNERNQKIIAFADKWIPKFEDKNTSIFELLEKDFGDDCIALNFNMDTGTSFCEKYGTQTLDDCLSVLDKVEDIDILASAIFSNWRYYNHWAMSISEFDDNSRNWFVTMLEKLKELARK